MPLTTRPLVHPCPPVSPGISYTSPKMSWTLPLNLPSLPYPPSWVSASTPRVLATVRELTRPPPRARAPVPLHLRPSCMPCLGHPWPINLKHFRLSMLHAEPALSTSHHLLPTDSHLVLGLSSLTLQNLFMVFLACGCCLNSDMIPPPFSTTPSQTSPVGFAPQGFSFCSFPTSAQQIF